MKQQMEEQENLRRRWKQTAETIQTAKAQEREEAAKTVMGTLLSVLLTLLFVVGISVWMAQGIMAQ